MDITYKTFTRNPDTGEEWSEKEFEAFDWDNYKAIQEEKHEFEVAKAIKERELLFKYKDKEPKAVIKSSLGFDIDADYKAKENVSSLIEFMQNKNLTDEEFRDAHNEFQPVTIEDLQTIKNEIIEAGLAYYKKKWAIEKALRQAKTSKEVEAIEV